MKTLFNLIAIFLVLMIASSDAAAEERYTWRQTLDAIRQVETGGLPNEGVGARGDWRTRNGKRVAMALGPYQIWSAYHFDAAERDKSLTNYQSCLTSKAYSEKVVRAYMHRYSRAALLRLEAGTGTLADVERVARIHNGGPRGHSKTATLKYWRKVEAAL